MAKKSAKNPTADSTAITVLQNQIPTRFIAPVDKNYWTHLGDNFWEIPVEQFTEHPENAKIFRNKWKEQKQLENSIGVNGVLVPLIANLRKDGELRLVSGHRRLSGRAVEVAIHRSGAPGVAAGRLGVGVEAPLLEERHGRRAVGGRVAVRAGGDGRSCQEWLVDSLAVWTCSE